MSKERRNSNMEKLIYQTGEAIILEVDDVEEVTYPKSKNVPDKLFIKTKDGRRFELKIKETVA